MNIESTNFLIKMHNKKEKTIFTPTFCMLKNFYQLLFVDELWVNHVERGAEFCIFLPIGFCFFKDSQVVLPAAATHVE